MTFAKGLYLLSSLALLIGSHPQAEAAEPMIRGQYLSVLNEVSQVVNHPDFRGFGKQILPNNFVNPTLKLSDIGSVLPNHSNVKPREIVEGLNHLIEIASYDVTIFHRFYNYDQMIKDPSKADTGLFYIPARQRGPYAVICPGGDMEYVGSLQDGFPLANQLNARGTSAFVIKYRTTSFEDAAKDMVAALAYINAHADEFNVIADEYSVWGNGSGNTVVNYIDRNLVVSEIGHDLPQPTAMILSGGGVSAVSRDDAQTPVFVAAAGAEENRRDNERLRRNVDKMRESGKQVMLRTYEGTHRGYGTGAETEARGWARDAVHYWRGLSKKRPQRK